MISFIFTKEVFKCTMPHHLSNIFQGGISMFTLCSAGGAPGHCEIVVR